MSIGFLTLQYLNRAVATGGDEPPPAPFTPIAGVSGEMVNGKDRPTLHKYTGFPWVDGLSDGTIVSVYKESANHVAAGPMMFGKSDGGTTFNFQQISVPGYGDVECSNLSFKVLSGDRILISWQTNAENSQMFFAWSANKGVSWNYIGGITYHPAANAGANTGYYAAQYGKPVEMPSGKILQPYYDAPVSGTGNQHGGFVEVNSTLTTLSMGSTVSTQTGAAFPNGYHSEFFAVITEKGTTDDTTKMVAIQRNESYEAFTHYRSADGGQTWTRNDTYLLNVFYPNAADRYPISDIVYHGGFFYIIVGLREWNNYRNIYSKVSATDLWNNTGYGPLVTIAEMYADTNASSIDCGYPTAFSRVIPSHGINEMVVQWYDSDTTWDGVTGEKRERIVQTIITGL